MQIDRLHMFIGRQEATVPTDIEVTQEDLDAGKPVHGQLSGYTSSDLKPYIQACDEGKLLARLHGKDYRVTQLSLEGVFTLQKL
jgi:hypothetical protein